MKTSTTIIRFAAGALLAVLVLGACAGGGSDDAGPGDAGADLAEPQTEEADPEAAAGGRGDSAGGEGGGLDAEVALSRPVAALDAQIIRDATLEVRVDDFDAAWLAVRRTAGRVGGYLSNASTEYEEIDGERYAAGWATLRIPSEQFDATLDSLTGLGERVSHSMSGEDVTEEYVDLRARLTHWERAEEFTLGLMDQAKTVEESLSVRERLDEIQLTIEQIEGRLRYLDSRVTFSTITVGISEVPAPLAEGPPVEAAPITEAFAQAVEVILAAVSFMIVAAAFLIPFAAVAGVSYALWRLVRRLRSPRPTESA